MRALGSCDVGLQDVLVPDELLLGEPGQAWYMLLPTLNNERIILASFCCGILDGVLEDALAYVRSARRSAARSASSRSSSTTSPTSRCGVTRPISS